MEWAASERGFWMDVPDRAGENPTTSLSSLRVVKAGGSSSWASTAWAFDRMAPLALGSVPAQLPTLSDGDMARVELGVPKSCERCAAGG
ncbi:hypothetical protein CGRA01v4_08908 [Colletotrichum graminicola]|nr:hypothetical protein CGRA01v4_08908 [Colletotrichum graminicola]